VVQAPSKPIVPNGAEDVIAQWSGGGMMTTRPFHVDGPWELEWSASSVFAAQLVTVGGSAEDVALQSAAGRSSSYEPVGGDFYLKVEGSGEWTMKAVRLQDAQPLGGDNARATPPAIEIPQTGTLNATPETLPSVRTSSDVPFAEMALIRASQAALSQYKTGENDMQKGAARPMRAQAICSVLTSKQAQDWVGTVYTLDTNGEGKGVLSVLIAPDIYVATWNNALSDVSDGTLIDPRSNVFTVASQLRTGQKIRFSGQFFASETDCIEERSLTLGGSITEPEYVIKFGSVSALE
jgi:hypothetical protein